MSAMNAISAIATGSCWHNTYLLSLEVDSFPSPFFSLWSTGVCQLLQSKQGLPVTSSSLNGLPYLPAPLWRMSHGDFLTGGFHFSFKSWGVFSFKTWVSVLDPQVIGHHPHIDGRHKYSKALSGAVRGLFTTLANYHPGDTQTTARYLTP
jgi:hypothetical protein